VRRFADDPSHALERGEIVERSVEWKWWFMHLRPQLIVCRDVCREVLIRIYE
jgi:hypothetical protein